MNTPRYIITSLFIMLLTLCSQAQQSIINAGAQGQRASGGSIEWTLGELFSETYAGPFQLTQGLLQPILLDNTTFSVESLQASIQILPNPTNDYFHISSDELSMTTLELLDNFGRQIETYNVQSDHFRLNVASLPTAPYFIKIGMPSGDSYSYRVIKN